MISRAWDHTTMRWIEVEPVWDGKGELTSGEGWPMRRGVSVIDDTDALDPEGVDTWHSNSEARTCGSCGKAKRPSSEVCRLCMRARKQAA